MKKAVLILLLFCAVCGGVFAGAAKDYYKSGNEHYKNGDFNKAIADFTEAITLKPRYVDAYNNRGLAYDKNKDFDMAIADYTEAIRLNPSYVDAYYNRGLAYANKKDYDKAIAEYTEAIKLNPSYANAYSGRGYAYSVKKDYDKAIVDYTEAIKLNPSLAAYYNRGIAYAIKKNYDKAIADYTEAIKLNPSYAMAYYNRGVMYGDKKDYDKAIADYTEAIKLNPSYADAYNNRGGAYYNKKDYDKAIADYTEVIRLNPSDANAYNNRGITYEEKKDYDKAIADFTEVIRLKPDYVNAYNNRGNAYKEKKDYDKAIADYTEAIRLNPSNGIMASAYNYRGIAYREKKDYDKAIADYNEAIRLKPSNGIMASAYNNRGITYINKKDYDKANADFAEAFRLYPSNDASYDKAIAEYTEAIKLDHPKKDSVYYLRGVMYSRKNVHDKAIADFTEVIRLRPSYADAYNNRGNAYKEKNDYDKAIADFEAVLLIDPNNTVAQNNKKSAVWDKRIAANQNLYPAPFEDMYRFHQRGYASYERKSNIRYIRDNKGNLYEHYNSEIIPGQSEIKIEIEFKGKNYTMTRAEGKKSGTFYYSGDTIELDDGTVLRVSKDNESIYLSNYTLTKPTYRIYPKMVLINGGTFTMGSPANEAGRKDDEVQHQVTVSSFYMANYEVTEWQWGSKTSKGNPPADSIDWYDAVKYCNRLSQKEGLTPAYTIDENRKDPNNTNDNVNDYKKWTVTWNRNANGYRLPTEAEWEYAAKGGNGSPGNYIYAGSNNIYEVAWHRERSISGELDVGAKKPNRLGLYDMSGGVSEWCWDWYGTYASGAQTDPLGASSGSYRVLRGGNRNSSAEDVRSAARNKDKPVKHSYTGFRVVRNAQ